MKLSYVETVEAITIDADRVLRDFAAPEWVITREGDTVTIADGKGGAFMVPWSGVRRAKA